MDLPQLRVFLQVARQESMTKAAASIHLAQPVISKTIMRLEQELDAPLFFRKSRGVSLTPIGEVFFLRVEAAIRELDNACVEVQNLSNRPSGTLNLLMLSASAFLPSMLLEFSKTCPDVRFRLSQHASTSDYDLCISYIPEGEAINGDVLLSEEVMLAVPCESLLSSKDSIYLTEAQEEHFICMRAGSSLRNLSDLLFKEAGFDPIIVYESDTPATVRALMQLGLGVAFLPAITWRSIVDERIKPLHIHSPFAIRRLCITAPKNRSESQVSRIFQRFAVNYFATLQETLRLEKE